MFRKVGIIIGTAIVLIIVSFYWPLLFPSQRAEVTNPVQINDSASLLTKADAQVLAAANNKMAEQKKPAVLWVRTYTKTPKNMRIWIHLKGNDAYNDASSLSDFQTEEVTDIYNQAARSGIALPHNLSWYTSNVSLLIIVKTKRQTYATFCPPEYRVTDLQRTYLHALLPMHPKHHVDITVLIKLLSRFVSSHTHDTDVPGYTAVDSGYVTDVVVFYLVLYSILGIWRLMRKPPRDYDDGYRQWRDGDRELEDEQMIYGDDWDGLGNNDGGGNDEW